MWHKALSVRIFIIYVFCCYVFLPLFAFILHTNRMVFFPYLSHKLSEQIHLLPILCRSSTSEQRQQQKYSHNIKKTPISKIGQEIHIHSLAEDRVSNETGVDYVRHVFCCFRLIFFTSVKRRV